jgi:malonate-semialdehyde dehydrogenase (acetylating)/methylmalonate-semialdehyde dehydrogenase
VKPVTIESQTESRAATEEPRTLRNYVGGEWRSASATEVLEDRDPVSGEVAAVVPLSGAADVDAAVRAAREAQPAWRDLAPQRRARAIMRLRQELVSHQEELARLVTDDMGKTIDDARGEVGRGIESVEAATAIPHLLKGENLEGVANGVDVEMVRQPVGVVAAITPFNFPAMIPLWFLPYAIACGNAFILKPSELDPRPAALIVEMVDAVEEIPAGVVNLVHGGRDAVTAILEDPGIDAISFVGRAETARIVAKGAVATGKRVQALGGAKNSLVVMPDADLGQALPAIMGSSFGAAGQRCLAGSICVSVGDGARHRELREALVGAASELVVGDGRDPATDVCPMVSAPAREKVAEAIGRGEQAGAELLLDGRGDAGPAGTVLGPTIAVAPDREGELAREELFGPLLTLVEVESLEQAIEFLNGSRYGNAGAIFTRSGAAARAYRHGAEAGMLGVNVGVPAPVAWFPFSGWKDSIDGDLHANGSDAVDFYTRKKVITSRW